MEIIKSNKKNDKVCLDGHMYTLYYETSKTIKWRCSKKSSLKCPAVLSTDKQITEYEKIHRHNHLPNRKEVMVTKALMNMKEKSSTTTTNLVEIFANGVSKLDKSAKAQMPSEDTVKRTLRNHRSKGNPIDPKSLEDCIIPPTWTINSDGHRFLLYDNGIVDENGKCNADERIVIFATDEVLLNLAKSSTWMMDGNFALAPVIFQQLYVIRVKINDIFVTSAFCLLQRKTQSTYEVMFKAIISECEKRDIFPDPSHIHVDFEKAIIQAIRNVFGEHSEVKGCYYHLTQSTHRKIQQLGLENLYRENDEFMLFCGQVDSLAFLPVSDIFEGMSHLRKIMPEEAHDLVEYFDQTYVNGTYRRIGQGNKLKFRKVPPLFPPEIWNVHESTLHNIERTNNQTEGFNNRFSKLVSHKHPSIWNLIKKMTLEVAADETKLQQRLLGTVQPKKKLKKYEKMQFNLKKICEEYRDKQRDLPNFY